ncbi:MAG: hypothetical protein JO307_34105 [Bryobacterales bacterium]|nr:hypothetical protein [Bryobacterales bacterium]
MGLEGVPRNNSLLYPNGCGFLDPEAGSTRGSQRMRDFPVVRWNSVTRRHCNHFSKAFDQTIRHLPIFFGDRNRSYKQEGAPEEQQ